jgi:hypothetical protein
MVSFKQFLTENPYRPVGCSPETLVEWAERNAPQYLKRMAQYPIFRGMDAPEYGIINTNGMNRTSANTLNYYTVWMDNDKDWEGYPKRSKALICSTSSGTANGFGETNLVIPADSNKIGICSETDLWGAFSFLTQRLGVKYMSMDEFVSDTNNFLCLEFNDAERAEAEKSYPKLVHALKTITFEIAKLAEERSLQPYLLAFEENGYKNLYDLWRDVMQPEENDFKLETGATFKVSYDVEVWTQGECAVINLDEFEKARSDMHHPLAAFINKHDLRGAIDH